MLGSLTESEIEDLLASQVIARIGCNADNTTYIVPINYVYEGNYLDAHSAPGWKIDIMRKNPDVCIEVENITDMINWQCVIAWGRFEEIEDFEENGPAMQRFLNHLMPKITNEMGHPSHGITNSYYDLGTTIDVIIYRIELAKKTGRFKRRQPA